jgi:hypothetical protein
MLCQHFGLLCVLESGVLFFLVVWNKGLIELHPVKSTQLAFFDAVIALHINIFPMAYLNCRQLFHPPWERMHKKAVLYGLASICK